MTSIPSSLYRSSRPQITPQSRNIRILLLLVLVVHCLPPDLHEGGGYEWVVLDNVHLVRHIPPYPKYIWSSGHFRNLSDFLSPTVLRSEDNLQVGNLYVCLYFSDHFYWLTQCPDTFVSRLYNIQLSILLWATFSYYGFLSSGKGASISPNVGRSVGQSVGRSVCPSLEKN